MPTETIDWTALPPQELAGGAVSIGNFDGVHAGHRELAAVTVRAARAAGGPAVAVTFDPPPQAVLNPGREKPPLTTVADRADLLHAAGVNHVAVLRTDPGLLALSPEAFFEEVILRVFSARAVVEGYNFHFGRGRAGDNATLRRLCDQHGVRFHEVPPLHLGGEPVSSSRVRGLLSAGDVTAAAELLGRSYTVRGVVTTGAKRGRTIGFPTANLTGVRTLLPKDGVYAVRAVVNEQMYAAAANVGPNPTFGEDARKVEVHLLDFAGDLYGAEVSVEFVRRLRDTRPFAGVNELVGQLQRDVAEVRETVM
jgi:riboflavin kinase/FMN adenylyltransferase